MNKYKKPTVLVAAILIGILVITMSTIGAVVIHYSSAKYSHEDEQSYTGNLLDFDTDFTLTYISNGITHRISEASLSENNGILRLTTKEYATLKMDIDYTGEGMCYCRFRITESWQHTDQNGKEVITPKELSVYTLDSKFYDNRSYDGYIYCSEPFKGADTSVQAITKCAAGADAVDLLSDDDKAQFVDISIQLESAQWNQAADMWGFDKLPWEA